MSREAHVLVLRAASGAVPLADSPGRSAPRGFVPHSKMSQSRDGGTN